MASSRVALSSFGQTLTIPGKRRDLFELAVGYGLILLVIWTPRPLQAFLWCVAAAFVAAVTCLTFDGMEPLGLRMANFFQSIWVVGAALAIALVAVIVADKLHTLHLPGNFVLFIKHYWGYVLWASAQQFLLQCFLLSRLMRLLQNDSRAAILAAALFAGSHLPSPILVPVTLIGGLAACLLFLRYHNLFPVALAHAILGITVAITIPGPVDHNMRVGLSYLTYKPHRAPLSQP